MNYKNKINPNEVITKKQAVAYGIVAYYTLMNSAVKKQTCKDFGEEIITIMMLNPPIEIEKRADKILEKNNLKNLRI